MIRRKVTLAELARSLDGRLEGDPDRVVDGVSPPFSALPEDIVVIRKKIDPLNLADIRPGVIVAGKDQECPPGVPVIRIADAEASFSLVLSLFEDRDEFPAGIHPTAVVDKSASVGKGASVAEYCVIRAGAVIADGTVLHPGVFIGRNVRLGKNCVLYPYVIVHDGTVMGDRVTIKSHTVIAGRGFGFRQSGDRHLAIPQIGSVRIGSDVDIGSNVCVDRATIGETVIADGAKIDNLVQIAHNVTIGENAVVISQTGLSGSVNVGKGAILAGQVGIADHIDIGDKAVVAAKSGVLKNVAPGEMVLGSPSRPIMQFKRIEVLLGRLQDLFKRVDAIEKKIPGGQE